MEILSKLDRMRAELMAMEKKLDRALEKNPSYRGQYLAEVIRLTLKLRRAEEDAIYRGDE